MARELQEIYDAEAEERQQFEELIASIAGGLYAISDVSTFSLYRRNYEDRIDQYIFAYEERIKTKIRDAVRKIDPSLDPQKYIDEAFSFEYTIKGSRNKINLNGILARRGFKIKRDLTAEILGQNGFETPTQSKINSIKSAVLKKNKKSMGRIIGNEMHKAREQSKIDKIAKTNPKKGEKVFYYNTQNDDRVRPSHSALQGQMTLVEAQNARNSTMAEPNCRCYLTEI